MQPNDGKFEYNHATRTREEMIEALVQSDAKIIREEFEVWGEWEYLNNILVSGWNGYDQMDDDELRAEFQDRYSTMEITREEREKIEEKMAQQLTDDMDIDALCEFFYTSQLEFFEMMGDEELLEDYEFIFGEEYNGECSV